MRDQLQIIGLVIASIVAGVCGTLVHQDMQKKPGKQQVQCVVYLHPNHSETHVYKGELR